VFLRLLRVHPAVLLLPRYPEPNLRTIAFVSVLHSSSCSCCFQGSRARFTDSPMCTQLFYYCHAILRQTSELLLSYLLAIVHPALFVFRAAERVLPTPACAPSCSATTPPPAPAWPTAPPPRGQLAVPTPGA